MSLRPIKFPWPALCALLAFVFAAVLNEIGLQQTKIPAARLSFNLGVEAGQVAFVQVLVGGFVLGRGP